MSERKTRNQPDYDIRITNTDEQLLNDLKAISKNLDVSVSSLLRPEIKKFVKTFAPDYKIMPEKKR